jgi:hypothetical protein
MTPVIVVVRVIVRTIVVVILVVVRVIVRVLVRIFLPVVVDFFDNWPSTTRRGVRVSPECVDRRFLELLPDGPLLPCANPPPKKNDSKKFAAKSLMSSGLLKTPSKSPFGPPKSSSSDSESSESSRLVNASYALTTCLNFLSKSSLVGFPLAPPEDFLPVALDDEDVCVELAPGCLSG